MKWLAFQDGNLNTTIVTPQNKIKTFIFFIFFQLCFLILRTIFCVNLCEMCLYKLKAKYFNIPELECDFSLLPLQASPIFYL